MSDIALPDDPNQHAVIGDITITIDATTRDRKIHSTDIRRLLAAALRDQGIVVTFLEIQPAEVHVNSGRTHAGMPIRAHDGRDDPKWTRAHSRGYQWPGPSSTPEERIEYYMHKYKGLYESVQDLLSSRNASSLTELTRRPELPA